MSLFSEAVTWAVVFTPNCKREPHWSRWFIGREFAHCYLIRENGSGALIVDPLRWGIAIQPVEQPFNDVVLAHAKDATACVMYVADYRFNTYSIGRLFYNCVAATKAVLGLRRGRLVQSPKALYKWLLKQHGSNVVKPWSPWIGG